MTDQPHTPTTEHLGMLIWETIHNDVYETDLSVAGANNLVNKIMASEWYSAEIAAAEQRGAIKALREARSDWFQYADAINDTPSKYYPALWLKNRADQERDND